MIVYLNPEMVKPVMLKNIINSLKEYEEGTKEFMMDRHHFRIHWSTTGIVLNWGKRIGRRYPDGITPSPEENETLLRLGFSVRIEV